MHDAASGQTDTKRPIGLMGQQGARCSLIGESERPARSSCGRVLKLTNATCSHLKESKRNELQRSIRATAPGAIVGGGSARGEELENPLQPPRRYGYVQASPPPRLHWRFGARPGPPVHHVGAVGLAREVDGRRGPRSFFNVDRRPPISAERHRRSVP